MILVFYFLLLFIGLLASIIFLIIISKIEIDSKEMYFNNKEKFRNNKKVKIKVSLKIGKVRWLGVNLDKRRIEKIYLKIKKIEANSNISSRQRIKNINKKIFELIKNEKIRKELISIKINLESLNLNIRIANQDYSKTAYITAAISIFISNILPYLAKNNHNIYYKVEPVYVNQNSYDILADVRVNIKINQIIFALIRIKKETDGKNITKKKEGKDYGRTSNRKFNEHSYE